MLHRWPKNERCMYLYKCASRKWWCIKLEEISMDELILLNSLDPFQSSIKNYHQVEISTPLLTFSLLFRKIPLCHPKIIPIHFHVNFIPSLIALLITQSAHCEYSSVNDINNIYSSIMSCCWFEAGFCHKLGECFIYVR